MPGELNRKLGGFSQFSYFDQVEYSRLGKKVQVKGKDGTNQESDSVEANLLYDILKVLKKK